jgi:hypothetical protein
MIKRTAINGPEPFAGTIDGATPIQTPSQAEHGLTGRWFFVRWIWCLLLVMALTAPSQARATMIIRVSTFDGNTQGWTA